MRNITYTDRVVMTDMLGVLHTFELIDEEEMLFAGWGFAWINVR